MRIVVALGGSALLHPGRRPDADVQAADIVKAADAIAGLAQEHDVVVTHGNGPQLGLLAAESATDPVLSAPYPLDLLAAQTQGMIGSLLVRALHDALPGRRIAAVVTHALVREDDPAFARPTEFVGPAYDRDRAWELARERGWRVAEGTTGWRRVVPAPRPVGFVERDTVHALLDADTLVVCAGGGGVPVVADRDSGALGGTEAVVDKDLGAALLAEELKADFLLILTDVPCVYAGYGTEDRHPLTDTTPAELRRNGCRDGAMGPKAQAAARFVARTGALAAIGAVESAYNIVRGREGTLIRPDLPS